MSHFTCECGGSVELVLTRNDDVTETFGPECIECGADFSDPDIEMRLDLEEEDGFRPVPRLPE